MMNTRGRARAGRPRGSGLTIPARREYTNGRQRGTAGIWLAVALALCAYLPAAHAVLPSINLVSPRGAQRGTEIEVTFNGANLGDAEQILFYEPGITQVEGPRIEEQNAIFKLGIAPDCAVGTHALRIRTRTGITNIALLSIGNLPERNETEPNNLFSEAEAVELNTTTNGVVNPEDVDYFSVNLEAGAKLAVEVEALRLGRDQFDPKLRLYDPSKHEVLAEDDTTLFRQDAGFVYVAQDAGPHVISVSEASYGGSGTYAYRLHIGQFPRPLSVTPLGGPPGTEVTVNWLGDPNLGAQPLLVPAVAPGTEPIIVQAENGVSPSGIPFRVSTLATVAETEPNNGKDQATAASIPAAFEGVIAEAKDVDRFTFPASPGKNYQIKVWARDLGSPLDSVIAVLKPDGSGLASNDDNNGIDSAMAFSAPEEGAYQLVIRDHLMRGGPLFTYRIEITEDAPALTMSLIENDRVALLAPQDNRTFLLVNANRAGFGADIRATLEELPAGLTHSEAVIPNGQSVYPVIVYAAADAPVAGALARIVGAQVVQEGQPITGELLQNYRLIEGANNTTFFGRDVRRLAVAVSPPAPFKVELVPPAAPFVRDGYRDLVVKAARAEGFKDAINLRFPWLPGGMGGGTATIPAEQDTATIRLEVRGDAAVGQHRIFVQADAAGYLLCSDWTPIEVQDQWVTFEMGEIETEQGKPVELKVAVRQHQPYEGEWELQVTGLPKGVTTENQKFTKDTAEVVFPLQVAAEAPEGKFGPIVARAAIVVNNEPVSHNSGGGQLKVFKPLPPELQAQQPPPPPPSAAPEEQRKTRFPT